MPESKYQFDDPAAAVTEAEKRIQNALDAGAKELDLEGLGLTELPESLAKLTHLERLNASTNLLSRLPDFIGGFAKLSWLDLEANQLYELPESLRCLRLQNLWLDGNSLGLPRELVEMVMGAGEKPATILEYYFRSRQACCPLNEAKLILLGRGEVGKTSLVNRLIFDKFSSTSVTRGIAITQWSVTSRADTIRLHVWDFGGQEIQHATHQFFLTERSLYLVVLNGRAGAEDEDAEYWLRFVKTYGGNSPTIVVLNKFKVQPFQVNRRALQQKYPFIRAFVETDCRPKADNGIFELKLEIISALAGMEYVRAKFPICWFSIKERLAEMKEPFISFTEYRKICAELGEDESEAQERLAGVLNALGVALNFSLDPQLREKTVLSPHWISRGVYQIITSKMLADRQGELRLSDLVRILPKNTYPPEMHGFLVELMRKFELCFPFSNHPDEDRFVVPELLSKEEPALGEPFDGNDCLSFRYSYKWMPSGLFSRTMARLHSTFIAATRMLSRPEERWRMGVVLHWEGCRALVKADKEERQVLVRVYGKRDERRRLLAVIRENFDQIHAEMKEFKPSEWIALEGYSDEWVSCSELKALEQRQVKEWTKSVGVDVVTINVSEMLSESDVARPHRIGPGRPLKLFISYAHEDERWRARLEPNISLLEREGLIQVWCDLQIKAGEKWDDEIKLKLNEADVFLFLMSTDLLASTYVQDVELPIARMRHEGKTAVIVPVVVRACSWTKYLGEIQCLPKAGKPVKEWSDKDQAFHDVELGLRKTVAEFRKSRNLG